MAWTWLLYNRSASSGVQANLAYVLNINDSGPTFHQLDLKLADLLLPRFRDLEKKRIYRFRKLAEQKQVAKKTWKKNRK